MERLEAASRVASSTEGRGEERLEAASRVASSTEGKGRRG